MVSSGSHRRNWGHRDRRKNNKERGRFGTAICALTVIAIVSLLIQKRKFISVSGLLPSLRKVAQEVTNANNATPPAVAENEKELQAMTPAQVAFSKLELFVSAFPGTQDLKDNNYIDGFTELKECFIRSVQFFWPHDQLRIAAVLDDTTYANEQDRLDLVTKFKSLFAEDVASGVNISFNHLTNATLYGSGWYIQQLIMLWADNFTDAEYIGFVDDDTIFTHWVQPSDIFDAQGRPRVIGQPARAGRKDWMQASEVAFQQKPYVYTMTYFPVVVKRSHLQEMRDAIMRVHPAHSCFDEFYTALIHRFTYEDKSKLSGLSQFCIMMDFVFAAHRDEYAWHIDPIAALGLIPEVMVNPFPKVAIHGSYLFKAVKRLKYSNTVAGRRQSVSNILKEGYCYSVPRWNATELMTSRCDRFNVDENIYHRGEWQFEQYGTHWNSTATAEAHAKRMATNVEHSWDEKELITIFGVRKGGRVQHK